jgi:hypothetical protein
MNGLVAIHGAAPMIGRRPIIRSRSDDRQQTVEVGETPMA